MSFDEVIFPILPPTWASVPVDEVCNFVSVKYKVQKKNYLKGGRLPVVDQGSDLVGGYTEDTSLAIDTDFPVVVFGDHTRALKYIDFAFAAGADGIKVLRPNEYFQPRLFYRFLQAIQLPDKGYARHFQYLRSSQIALPPLNEQKRIAEKLDAVLARVDACRERLDRMPAILKRFRQAVVSAAVTGKLTEDWCSQQPPQVDDSPSWRTTLADLCLERRVITYGVIKLGEETPHGVPCLRTSNVRWLRIDTTGLKRIAPTLSAEYARTILDGSEVLVNVRGTLGGVAVATADMQGWNVSREVAVIPVDPAKADSNFLALLIASDRSQRWLSKVEKGVAYIGINIEDLRTLPVELPALHEQREIVRRVEALFALADRVEARYTTGPRPGRTPHPRPPRQGLSRRAGAAGPERRTGQRPAGAHPGRPRRSTCQGQGTPDKKDENL